MLKLNSQIMPFELKYVWQETIQSDTSSYDLDSILDIEPDLTLYTQLEN